MCSELYGIRLTQKMCGSDTQRIKRQGVAEQGCARCTSVFGLAARCVESSALASHAPWPAWLKRVREPARHSGTSPSGSARVQRSVTQTDVTSQLYSRSTSVCHLATRCVESYALASHAPWSAWLKRVRAHSPQRHLAWLSSGSGACRRYGP